jgi:hypothetical protein
MIELAALDRWKTAYQAVGRLLLARTKNMHGESVHDAGEGSISMRSWLCMHCMRCMSWTLAHASQDFSFLFQTMVKCRSKIAPVHNDTADTSFMENLLIKDTFYPYFLCDIPFQTVIKRSFTFSERLYGIHNKKYAK